MLICFKEDCLFGCSEALLDCIMIEGEGPELTIKKLVVLRHLNQSYGLTLLHYTPECDTPEVAKHLLEIGCDVKAMSRTGYTPLMITVKHNGIKSVKVLLKNNGTICVGDPCKAKGLEPLLYRVFLHNFSLQTDLRYALKLVAHEINKNFAKNERATMMPVQCQINLVKLAVVASCSVKLAKFVLANGYDLEYRVPKRKWTALHVALILGKFENAKLLIERGANVDAVDQYEKTPLSYYKADEEVDEKSKVLLKLLERSVNKYKGEDVEKIIVEGKKETLRALLQNRIDVTQESFRDGKSFLHLLVENENDDVVEVLEEMGVNFDVNARKADEETALMIAAHAGFVGKVEFLLRHGAEVNATLDSGESALFYAVKRGMRGEQFSVLSEDAEAVRVRIAILLLQSGAEAQLVPDNGKTLIDYLSRRRKVSKPMAKVFVAHLAMLAAIDESNLTDHTSHKIQNDETLKAHFDSYTRQLDQLKDTKVHGTVTLFKLLSEREGKIVGYARNPDLVSAFSDVMKKMSHLGYYYTEVLHNRMKNARSKAESMEKAALAIEELTGICTDAYHVIAYKIVDYLKIQDMNRLCVL